MVAISRATQALRLTILVVLLGTASVLVGCQAPKPSAPVAAKAPLISEDDRALGNIGVQWIGFDYNKGTDALKSIVATDMVVKVDAIQKAYADMGYTAAGEGNAISSRWNSGVLTSSIDKKGVVEITPTVVGKTAKVTVVQVGPENGGVQRKSTLSLDRSGERWVLSAVDGQPVSEYLGSFFQ